MQTYINLQKIERLSEGDESVPFYQKIIKLGEESGEVSDAFKKLRLDKSEENIAEVIEECCDVINVAVDIINTGNKNKAPGESKFKIDKDSIYYQKRYQYDIATAVLDLYSECGKVHQNFLRLEKAKNVSRSAEGGLDVFLKQTFKVIQAAHIIIDEVYSDYNLPNSFVRDMFERKLDKWESKQNGY